MGLVLLIDEVQDDREIYQCGLRALGYEVALAARAEAAATVAALLPDIVVLHLTGEDCWQICQHLGDSRPELPVILITASVRPDRANRDRAQTTGNCAAFVGKPCTHEQLAAVIARVLRGERGIELTIGSQRRRVAVKQHPPRLRGNG